MLKLEAKYHAFTRFIREKAKTGSVESLLEATPSKLILLFPELISASFVEINREAGIVRCTSFAGPKDPFHFPPRGELFRFDPEEARGRFDDRIRELIDRKLNLPERYRTELIPIPITMQRIEGYFALVFQRDIPDSREVTNQIQEMLPFLTVHIENLSLKSQLEEINANYEIIAKTLSGKKLAPEEEAGDLFKNILETAVLVFQAQSAVLFKRDGNTLVSLPRFKTVPPSGSEPGDDEPVSIELLAQETVPDTQIFDADFYREKIENKMLPAPNASDEIRSLTIPLSPFGKHTYIIALFFDSLEQEKWDRYRKSSPLFSQIASSSIESNLNRASLSLATKELVHEKKSVSNLLHLTNLVSSTLDVKHSLNIAIKKVRELFDADRCSIIIKAQGKNEYVIQYSSSRDTSIEEPVGIRLSEEECPYLFSPSKTKKALTIDKDDALKLNVKERGLMYALNINKMLLAPVFNHGEFKGLLTIDRTESAEEFTEREIDLVSAIANQISSAIGNASLFTDVLRSKNEWELIFNSISDGIFVIDMDYTITNFNRVFAEKYGFDSDSIIGMKCYDLFSCKKVETDACGHIQCIKENKSIEATHIYSDIPGTFKVTISPVYDERGEVEKSVHFIKDITKEIEYEQQLKESLKRAEEISNYLETLIESSTDSIISTDQEGKVVYFSKGASEILGYEPEEIQGKHVSEVYPSLEDAKKIGRAMRKNNGKIRNYNVSLKRKDGSLVEVLLSASTLFDEEGKSAGTVGISKDLSKIKKMEEYIRQSEKLTALGKLASGIAHDFNNILAAISMRAELMKIKVKEPEHLKDLEVIENAAHSGAATVKKLRSFYKRDRKTFSPLNLNDVIREAVDITSPRWKDMSYSKGISIELALHLEEKLKIIRGNEGELKDTFINLIINSLDAMPEGGKIKISTENVRGTVKVIFTDSGLGMKPRIRDRAFEPFFSTKGEKGSGLGLSTVYGIVTSHGGRVELESWEGKGTSFIIHLPVSEIEVQEEPRYEEVKDYDITGTRVILFEDEEPIRDAIREVLTEKGCNVIDFYNSRIGLKFLRENLPTLHAEHKVVVITDLGMPDINGLEIARRVKELESSVPVVMITGWGSFMEQSQGNIYGVDRIVPKPVRSRVLVQIIGELVS